MSEFVSKDTLEAHLQRIDRSFEDGAQKMALSNDKTIADFRTNVEVKVSEIRGDMRELRASVEGSVKAMSATMEGSVKAMGATMEGSVKELRATMEGSVKELRAHDEERAKEMDRLIKTLESTTSEIREDTRSSRTAIWGMAISVVLAVAFGTLGLIITVTKSNETLLAAIAQIVKAKP